MINVIILSGDSQETRDDEMGLRVSSSYETTSETIEFRRVKKNLIRRLANEFELQFARQMRTFVVVHRM